MKIRVKKETKITDNGKIVINYDFICPFCPCRIHSNHDLVLAEIEEHFLDNHNIIMNRFEDIVFTDGK